MAKGGGYRVTITCYRRRLIDPDNLCTKFAIDAIRGPGRLLSDDSAGVIRSLIVRQEKGEPKTVIEIEEMPCSTID